MNCNSCAFRRLIPAWRKRQRTSPHELSRPVVECVRMPLPVVKLITEWCAEYQPADDQRVVTVELRA